jgi:hypothetical protein
MSIDMDQLPLPLQNIIRAFDELKDQVRVALLTQLGDAARLQVQIHSCEQLRHQINMVCISFIQLGDRY